jgi:hypothetical protein
VGELGRLVGRSVAPTLSHPTLSKPTAQLLIREQKYRFLKYPLLSVAPSSISCCFFYEKTVMLANFPW